MLIEPAPPEETKSPTTEARDLGFRGMARSAWAKVAAGIVVLYVALWLDSAHVFAGNSDGATVILEGHSIASGNLLLSGWSLSLDSFWGIDTVFYALASDLVGIRGYLLHAVPAAIALCVVAVGAIMARDAREQGRGLAGMVAAVALLGAPTGALSAVYLTGPLHVGTALWALIAFFALRRGRFGWGWALAVAVLTFGLLGDLLTLPLGVAPVIGVGILEMVRYRSWRHGIHSVSAGVAALGLAKVMRAVLLAAGTFSIAKANSPAPVNQVPVNLEHLPTFAAWLFGLVANAFDRTPVPTGVALSHGLGLFVVVGSVLLAALGLLEGLWRGKAAKHARSRAKYRLDDFLVVAFMADVTTFVLITPNNDPSYARYLTPAYIFGSILAARIVTRIALRRGATVGGRIAGAVALVATGGYAAGLLSEVVAPTAPNSAVQLAGFLKSHHLHLGVGDYWSSSITTVLSNNKVVVRPVVANNYGHVVRYGRQSSAHWYKGKTFQFLVYNPGLPWGGITPTTIQATFGGWSREYTVGTYVIYVWNNDIHVGPVGYY